MPTFTRTTAYLRRTRRGDIDERVVTEAQRRDPRYLPRLTWSTYERAPRDDAALLTAMRGDRTAAFFIDNSFIDDTTNPDLVTELLAAPERLRITQQVHTELQPYLGERPAHPLARALREGDPAVVLHPTLGLGDRGRIAMEYYVSLLLRRRLAGDVVRRNMADALGEEADEQDPATVRAETQRRYGERGLMLAEKTMSLLATDEILVYRAVEHAIRTGQNTAILTRDHDIEEQFFKLTYLMCGHYEAMLCADGYAKDFASFRTIPISERLRDDDWWPLMDGGAILVDATRWGSSQEDVFPANYTFVGVSCINTGPVSSQMAFGAERGMARLLDVKDRTRGRSTEELGSRNIHVLVPENMRPAHDSCPYVLIARDVTVKLFDARADVPWLDVGQALFSDERPRHVRYTTKPRVIIPRQPAPSPLPADEAFRSPQT